MTKRKTVAERQRAPKGEGSIRERLDRPPASRFEGRLTIPELGTRKSFWGPDYDTVQDKMREFLVAHRQGKAPHLVSKLTVRQYLEYWLEHAGRLRVNEAVWRTYESYTRNHVLPALGNERLSELTPLQVQHFLTACRKPTGPRRRPLAPRTIRQIRWMLSGAFEDAVSNKLMERNLAKLVTHPKVERHHPTFLTPDQANLFLRSLPLHPLGAVYAVALGTGLRLGETMGLCWSDLNLTTGNLALTHQLKPIIGGWVLAEPKADSVRAIALPAFSLELVLQYQRQQQAADALRPPPAEWKDLIFRRPDGRPYSQQYATFHLHKFTAYLGLPELHFHELRHTAASFLIEAGANLKEVQEFLGHSAISITADYYLHLYTDQAQRNARRMEEILRTAQPETPGTPGTPGQPPYGSPPVAPVTPTPPQMGSNQGVRVYSPRLRYPKQPAPEGIEA